MGERGTTHCDTNRDERTVLYLLAFRPLVLHMQYVAGERQIQNFVKSQLPCLYIYKSIINRETNGRSLHKKRRVWRVQWGIESTVRGIS